MYTAMRDKCSTMYEFRGLIAKKFGPIILMQVMEDFGMNTQLFKNYIADIQMNRETRNLSEALSGIKQLAKENAQMYTDIFDSIIDNREFMMWISENDLGDFADELLRFANVEAGVENPERRSALIREQLTKLREETRLA